MTIEALKVVEKFTENDQASNFDLPEITPVHPTHSYDEFTKLNSIIVGSPFGANHPELDMSMISFFQPPSNQLMRERALGPIPKRIIDEINEDVEDFVSVLKKKNIEVLRPDPYDSTKSISTPHWQSEQLYSLMPRDTLLIVGESIIEVPSPTRSRYFEVFPFRRIIDALWRKGGRWYSAPKPLLEEDTFNPNSKPSLLNFEILFDGANCVRFGQDIFMDINNSANELGLRWLQQMVGEKFKIHHMEMGQDHADVTLVPIRPGLVILNPKRVNKNNLPSQFENWDKIVIDDTPELSFGLSYPLASNGIGRNVLMLDPETAVVEENQTALIKALEKYKISVIPLRYRHGRTLGGMWHCITLDVNRSGGLDNYFS